MIKHIYIVQYLSDKDLKSDHSILKDSSRKILLHEWQIETALSICGCVTPARWLCLSLHKADFTRYIGLCKGFERTFCYPLILPKSKRNNSIIVLLGKKNRIRSFLFWKNRWLEKNITTFVWPLFDL